MALPVLPNRDNFLGVALAINRSRDGPRFVFHYPPRLPPVEGARKSTEYGDRTSEGDGNPAYASDAAELTQWNHDDHFVTESGTQIVPWEHVAGFPAKDLENILTPPRAYHKRLFQVSLDPLYCVSYPIYVPESGVWRKKRKNKDGKEQRPPQKDAGTARKDDSDAIPTDTGGSTRSGGEKGASDAERTEARDMLKPLTKATDEAEDKKSSMTMFNLVFFLNPKKHEVKPLVDIMFTHIIKKINKAYKYCQQRSDFVWKESKKILLLKDKGREEKTKMSVLWDEILSASSLAASMQDIYEAVSQNKIAALQLDTAEGMVTHSVQIPIPFHVSDIPQEGEQGQPGLWLTTANSLMGEEAVETPGFLDKNFGLLLMVDEKRVIAELQSDPDETTLAMIEFVRHCKPTLSFYQVCQQSSNVLTPAQIRKFAQHFIFWRRAIAIPPLHARDMYIVSPNCDLRKLPQAAARWARQFPLSPALPNFLAELSVAPRPYKLHCPSKAHRPVYMAMLAWLMRGGWVTQLCTFAYVVVWPEIIYEVEHALEAEEIARAKRAQSMGRASEGVEGDGGTTASTAAETGVATLGDPAVAGFASGFLPLLSDSQDSASPSTALAAFRDLSLSHSQSQSLAAAAQPSPTAQLQSSSPIPTPTSPAFPRPGSSSNSHNRNHNRTASHQSLQSLSQPQQTPAPTPLEQAAEKARLERLADKAARELAERATAHARKAPPQQTAHPSVNRARHLEGIAPHIILDAKKATGKESLYLSAIGRRLRDRAAAAAAAAGGGGKDKDGDSKDRSQNKGRERDRDTNKEGAKDAAADWDERVANAWPVFCKYFNGRSALERIALQEDMKRKDVWNLLTAMSEYLLCVRHW